MQFGLIDAAIDAVRKRDMSPWHIAVIMLDFELLNGAPKWYNTYMLRAEDLASPLTEHQKLVFLELPKLKKKLQEETISTLEGLSQLSPLEQWGAYFSGFVGNEVMEAIPILKSALEAESKFTENDKLMYENDMRDRAIRDYYSGLEDAKEEGLREGIQKGIEEQASETVKRLVLAGMDNAFIKTIVPNYNDAAIDAVRKELAEN